MKTKKVPMRTCVVTKQKRPKDELVRIVASKDGQVSIDPTGKLSGRGAYLTLSKEVFKKAKMSNILSRKLKTKVPPEIYDALEELIK